MHKHAYILTSTSILYCQINAGQALPSARVSQRRIPGQFFVVVSLRFKNFAYAYVLLLALAYIALTSTRTHATPTHTRPHKPEKIKYMCAAQRQANGAYEKWKLLLIKSERYQPAVGSCHLAPHCNRSGACTTQPDSLHWAHPPPPPTHQATERSTDILARCHRCKCCRG